MDIDKVLSDLDKDIAKDVKHVTKNSSKAIKNIKIQGELRKSLKQKQRYKPKKENGSQSR